MLILIMLLIVIVPMVWLVSEFCCPAWVRLSLGLLSILMSFGVAYTGSTLSRLNYNAWYGAATSDLLDTTLQELEAGNEKHVISELKQLQAEFHPTYENRATYDELVSAAVERLESTAPNGAHSQE